MNRHIVKWGASTDCMCVCYAIWKHMKEFKNSMQGKEELHKTNYVNERDGLRGGWQVVSAAFSSPDRKQNGMKLYTLYFLYSQMFPVCCRVSTQLRARVLINGAIRLGVTQHFQVSLLDTDTQSLTLGFLQGTDGPVSNVPKWKHAHASVLWGGRLV